jgi:hypothetical protein
MLIVFNCVIIKFSLCSYQVLNDLPTCFLNSQCFPQYGPNNNSFYTISFALNHNLVTYIDLPKGVYDISILRLSKALVNFVGHVLRGRDIVLKTGIVYSSFKGFYPLETR